MAFCLTGQSDDPNIEKGKKVEIIINCLPQNIPNDPNEPTY